MVYICIKNIMGKNTSIILGEFYDEMIQIELKKGTYASASEMIREGLRLVHERNEKIKSINKVLELGEKSGSLVEWNMKSFRDKMEKKSKKNA